MRTIRFRAWDEQNKIMHNDFQFIKSGDEGNDWIVFTSDKQTLQDSTHPFENPYFGQQLKIMEYTGLKDKNGVKIFEGDIVKYYGYDYSEDGDFEYYKVEFTKECYGEKWGWDLVDIKGNAHEYYYGGFNAENCVVIGNIHSNPEILK